MAILLYLLLFIIIYYAVKAVFFMYTVYRKMHEATRQFREYGSAGNGSYRQSSTGYKTNSSSGYHNNGNQSANRSSYGNAGGGDTGSSDSRTVEEIYDTRSDEMRSRKIISSDEGEYVDFTEE